MRLKVFGVDVQKQWAWQAVTIIGFGFIGLQIIAIPTNIAITYVIDCYKPISGEIMAIATVCKNTFGVRGISVHNLALRRPPN